MFGCDDILTKTTGRTICQLFWLLFRYSITYIDILSFNLPIYLRSEVAALCLATW